MPRTNADDFRGPAWLLNPHLQTLGAALPLHAPASVPNGGTAETLVVPVNDRDAVVARAWWQREERPGVARDLALIVHGVGGSSESRYMLRAAHSAWRAGHHVVRLNMRGAGEGGVHASSVYHAGLGADPARVIDALSNDARVRTISIIGFSLGGNVALKLAAGWSDAPPPKVRAVATISAPLDLAAVSVVMERLRTLPYRAWVLRGLVRQALDLARRHPDRIPYTPRDLVGVRTVRQYDDRVVVPMHGFASTDDYYTRASSGPDLARITVPTLLVHADDDPMVPGDTVRPFLRHASRAVDVAWSARGGHVGWYAGFDEHMWVNTWAMQRVLAFLASR